MTNKYIRTIQGVTGVANHYVHADVYCVLAAFGVKCPATQHAIKKLLCAGLRGKGNRLQDLIEAKQAIERAIDMNHLFDKEEASK